MELTQIQIQRALEVAASKIGSVRIEATVSKRHAILFAFRSAMGWTQTEMSKYLEINYTSYHSCEKMRLWPGKVMQERIAKKLGMSPTDIFPPELAQCYGKKDYKVGKTIEIPEFISLEHNFEQLESVEEDRAGMLPQTAAFETNRRKIIEDVLGALPEKERDILKRYFGFNPYHEHTHAEIARVYGVSKARISQTIQRQIKILRKYVPAADFTEI